MTQYFLNYINLYQRVNFQYRSYMITNLPKDSDLKPVYSNIICFTQSSVQTIRTKFQAVSEVDKGINELKLKC